MKNILKKIFLSMVLVSMISCKNIEIKNIPAKSKIDNTVIKNLPAKPKVDNTVIKNLPAKPKTDNTVIKNPSVKSKTDNTVIKNPSVKPKTDNTVIKNPSVKPKTDNTVIKKLPVKSKVDLSVETFLDIPEIKNASLGIKVVNLKTDKTLFKFNPNKSLVPASNMKLLTAGAALEILGKDYRFKTTLAYDGEVDSEGILNGNIYIIGGGDPTLGSRYLVAKHPIWITTEEKKRQIEFLNIWAEKVKTMGIKKINGNIITDPSYYPTGTLSKTWEWGDLRYTFASKPSGLTFLDNSIKLTFSKDEKDIKTSISPTYTNTVVTNKIVVDGKGSSQITLVVPPYSNEIIALGTMNKPKISYNTVMQDPGSALGKVFSQTLEGKGIKNNGTISIDKVDRKINKKIFIYNHYSPKLEEIISYMNKYSINLFAEHLKIEMEKDSSQTIKKYWSKHLSTQGLHIYDGSGLSRYNGVTPNTIVEVFKYMKKSKNFSSFYNSLAEPGKYGTFEDFQEKTVLIDNFHGKSGTLTGIKSYGGYINNIDGDLLAFSIIVNHHGLSNSKISKELEKIIENIYYLK